MKTSENRDASRNTGVDFGTRFFYGFGSIANGAKDNGFRGLLLIYYNQVQGMPAGLVAFAIMTALVIDAILDPVVGQLSDTWRSRWGRRHPFMYLAAVPSAIFYLLLWNPPESWSQSQLFLFLVGIAIMVRTFITLYEIPNTALITEFTRHYDERTTLMSWRYLFFFWGSLALSVLTYRVLFVSSPEFPVAQLNPESYTRYGWIAAAVMLTSMLVSSIGTHRWIPRLQQPPQARRKSIAATARDMLETVSHPAFLTIMGAALGKSMAVGVSGALAIYMNTYFWELGAAQLAILVLDGFLAALFAAWLTPRLSKRHGKKATALWFFVLGFITNVTPLLLRVAGLFFDNDSVWLVPVLFVQGAIFGTFAIGSTILVASMIADCVEEGELRTGRRSDGLFFSASSFMQKVIGGVGVMGSGAILVVVAFPEQAQPGMVEQGVLNALVLTVVAVLTACYAVAIGCLARHDIDRASHEATLQQLASRQRGQFPLQQ